MGWVTWTDATRPACSACQLALNVYVTFNAANEPRQLFTWCPGCDPYSSNRDHAQAWAGRLGLDLDGLDIRVPNDDAAWRAVRAWMASDDGSRQTRCWGSDCNCDEVRG